MPLEGELHIDVDGGVEFVFSATNASADFVDLQFRSSFVADVAVFEDDEEVWRFSDGRAFAQALRTQTLEPGESLVQSATWKDPRPGTYTAVATLQATNRDVEAREGFSV